MSKSAKQTEREIADAVLRLPLRAAGLWCKMRIELETNCDGRPGEFRQNGTSLDAEDFATLARSTAAKVAPLLTSLTRTSVDPSGKIKLLAKTAEGLWHSPAVARATEYRGRKRRAMRSLRKNRVPTPTGGNVTPVGGNKGGNVTRPSPPAPSPSFSPTPPLLSSPSPPSPVLGAVGGESAGGGGRTGAKGGKPPEPDLPLLLAVHPGFVAAWADWRAHLRAKRVRVTPAAAERQLELCLDLGPERAVAAIRHSIAGSYQGLFEPGGAGKASGVNGHGAKANADEREEAAHRRAMTELEAEMRGAK